MRRFILLAAFLVLTLPQAVNACGICVKNSVATSPQIAEVNDASARVSDASAEGLSLSAVTGSGDSPEGCPCCPPETDCTDCLSCVGIGTAYVIPGISDSYHLPSTATFIDTPDTPSSRELSRPGRPPESILR